uniref:ATP synthase complex subunit 8 n=1 Tax=Desmomyia sinensis TaxID=2816992 RepID=A0A8A4VMV0_9DIPT|nr:ATP synthase F0 subunit 8 [Desmomyia sinensis]QTD82956.1 ATP synthase F0 subunit 8 [Desmomyia sinensis]
MPQMAPISWLILFFVFSITFMLFNIVNYFSFLPSSSTSKEKKTFNVKSNNWKW